MRGSVVYLTPAEFRQQSDLMRQMQMGWLEAVPAPRGEETPEKYRASHIVRLRQRQKDLSDELSAVNRELNMLGANDG